MLIMSACACGEAFNEEYAAIMKFSAYLYASTH
jgi:hypothetical protein